MILFNASLFSLSPGPVKEDEESVGDVLLQADMCLQYGEDEEPREPQDMEPPDDDWNDFGGGSGGDDQNDS